MSSRTRPSPAATRTAARRAERRAARLFAAGALLVASGCSWIPGYLTREEQAQVDTHKRTSKAWYDLGDYARAEDQCRRGLEIEDDATLKLTLGLSLLMQARPEKLEEAAELFRGEIGFFGSGDWRLHMGYGMTLQQLARVREASQDEGERAKATELRREAREELEEALERSSETRNTPADVSYNLAILDLEEGRDDLFPEHARMALTKLLENEKRLAQEIRLIAGDRERDRSERERRINSDRGRRLAREAARIAWEAGDWKKASETMRQLETFGPLARADYFDRARVRERNGDVEGAVQDFDQFIRQSGDQVDELVTQAIQSRAALLAQLAEKRTATQLKPVR
jgi:tetratricopeptide (TPR) repeat protein